MGLRELGFEPDPVIEAFKHDIDRSLIRRNLALQAVAELEALIEERQKS